jgi:hypothetical protein
VIRQLILALFVLSLVGCSDSKVETASTASGTPVSIPTTPVSHPADAKEAAKQIGFPLLDDPLKAPLAMVSDSANGEKHFEFDQVVKRSVKDAATFYEKALGIKARIEASTASIQDETADGKFIIMNIQVTDGKTAIAAKILTYSKDAKP